jgi:hypothetical protein
VLEILDSILLKTLPKPAGQVALGACRGVRGIGLGIGLGSGVELGSGVGLGCASGSPVQAS